MNRRRLFMKSSLLSGILLVVLCLFVSPLQATVLDQLVDEALTNNPALAASRARWQQATYNGPQVGSLKDPVISFAFSNYPNDNLSAHETPMTGNELKLAQAFPFPGKLSTKKEIAHQQVLWAQAKYADLTLQVREQVRHSWFTLNFQRQAIALTIWPIKLATFS